MRRLIFLVFLVCSVILIVHIITRSFKPSLTGTLGTDLEQFGGQQYGAEARCFSSTLREFGSVLSLDFTSYGLCYASNCYSEDYLQIGIRGRDGGTEWFGCPRGGGTLYMLDSPEVLLVRMRLSFVSRRILRECS